MKNFTYIINVIFLLNLLNISAMSFEEIKKYANQYKSLSKISSIKDPQALTLSQAIAVADVQTNVHNITYLGLFLDSGSNEERLRLLEYVVLYSLSLKNIYEVSAEQIRLMKILKDRHHGSLIKQLDSIIH